MNPAPELLQVKVGLVNCWLFDPERPHVEPLDLGHALGRWRHGLPRPGDGLLHHGVLYSVCNVIHVPEVGAAVLYVVKVPRVTPTPGEST